MQAVIIVITITIIIMQVIIMCKPPQAVTLNTAGSSLNIFPSRQVLEHLMLNMLNMLNILNILINLNIFSSRSRATGEVAAEPGPLVYEVALHRFLSYHISCIFHKVALYHLM